VVLGDFNADRDHAPFRALLGPACGTSTTSADAAGPHLAAGAPLLQLDHVLVKDGGVARPWLWRAVRRCAAGQRPPDRRRRPRGAPRLGGDGAGR
jgi:endonuclease/exonuclease/phosphatase family metal-dependent hydrolase